MRWRGRHPWRILVTEREREGTCACGRGAELLEIYNGQIAWTQPVFLKAR